MSPKLSLRGGGDALVVDVAVEEVCGGEVQSRQRFSAFQGVSASGWTAAISA